MPIDKYVYIRKAAEIEGIRRRLQMISDINAAFSGNDKLIKALQKDMKELIGPQIVTERKDTDWKERLLRFKR